MAAPADWRAARRDVLRQFHPLAPTVPGDALAPSFRLSVGKRQGRGVGEGDLRPRYTHRPLGFGLLSILALTPCAALVLAAAAPGLEDAVGLPLSYTLGLAVFALQVTIYYSPPAAQNAAVLENPQ